MFSLGSSTFMPLRFLARIRERLGGETENSDVMIQPPLSLLTHLVALRSALRERSADLASTEIYLDSPTHLNLELLPYAVCEMWHALTSFVSAAHSIAARLGAEIPLLPECFFLSDPDRDLLSYSIDLFIDSGRRAQNAVLLYLSSALGPLRQPLPKSLADVFTKLEQTNLTKYPALKPFAPVLESYWSTDGRRLKAYRDLMQHHALVATEAFLARSDAGIVCLHILLPNNPIAPLGPKRFHPVPSIEELSTRVTQSAQTPGR